MTVDYYNRHADDFVQRTVALDMRPFYEPFLRLLPPDAHILDAGCGSGRDTKEFRDRGYAVTAMDASEAICRCAYAYVGPPVICQRFEDLAFHEAFDGIWASA